MGTIVLCPQLRPSLASPRQLGRNFGKELGCICWKANLAGDYFSSFSTFSESLWASSLKSFSSTVKGSQREEIDQHRTHCKRNEVFTFVDGGYMHLIMHRTSPGYRKRKARSFVDEATAHSSDLGVSASSALGERSDGEAGGGDLASGESREPVTLKEQGSQILDQQNSGELNQRDEGNGEYASRISIVEAKNSSSVDLEYNYEDMKLGEQKNWSIVDMKKLDILRNFEYRHGCEKGIFVVQTMRVEHMNSTEELLVDSFAELMGGLLTYRPLLALTVRQYVRNRYTCLPDAVTLVGLYAPAEDNVVMGRTENGNWLLTGTVELSFSNAGHPDIPAGPAPPPDSPYLCNMAVSKIYRRRGLGRQLLKAAEELAVLMGAKDLYLHCRMVDIAPLNMYQGAGYQIVTTDSILSLLSFQRRRYLMRKRLPGLTTTSITS